MLNMPNPALAELLAPLIRLGLVCLVVLLLFLVGHSPG